MSDITAVAGLEDFTGVTGSCDICDCPAAVICTDRAINLCEHCLLPGRLGGLDHRMPRGEIVCAHRRKDSLAVKVGAGASVLYQATS